MQWFPFVLVTIFVCSRDFVVVRWRVFLFFMFHPLHGIAFWSKGQQERHHLVSLKCLQELEVGDKQSMHFPLLRSQSFRLKLTPLLRRRCQLLRNDLWLMLTVLSLTPLLRMRCWLVTFWIHVGGLLPLFVLSQVWAGRLLVSPGHKLVEAKDWITHLGGCWCIP